MNARLSALLIAGLAGLVLSGQAAAGPRFLDRDFLEFSVRDERAEREFGKREEREMRKANRQQDKKGGGKAEEQEGERGYGYGYERRQPHPGHDDRGRR
jgi:hypothetical protein